jgi:MYXO-CTERM domain-containing protein
MRSARGKTNANEARAGHAGHARRRLLAPSLLVAGLVAWGEPAGATPEFPGIVVQTLGLPGITIDPPNGCTLCHASDSGGTALRPFGLLVQQDGAQPYEDATLEAALGQIDQDQPELIADIKAGHDPNDDPSVSALPTTPQYGCSSSGGRGSTGWGAASFAVASLVALRRRRRRRLRA